MLVARVGKAWVAGAEIYRQTRNPLQVAKFFGRVALRKMLPNKEIASMRAQLDAAQGENALIRAQLDAAQGENALMRAQLGAAQGENALMRAQPDASVRFQGDIPAFSSAPFLEVPLSSFDPNEVARRFLEWGALLFRAAPGDDNLIAGYTAKLRTSGFYDKVASDCVAAFDIEQTEPPKLVLHAHAMDRLHGMLTVLFGADTFMSMAATSASCRRVFPGDRQSEIRWHQDHAPVGFPRLVTCWFLLDQEPCGEDSPGIEFVVQRNRLPLLRHEFEGGANVLTQIPARAGDFRWRPVIRPGDILAFDGFTPHRTFSEPSMRRARASADFRFAPFDAQVYGTMIALHAPIIANRHAIFGPVTRNDDQQTYTYGHVRGHDAELRRLYDLALSTQTAQT